MSLDMPGGISMSRLKVYDTTAPDSQQGGTPHVHFVCTEMYVIVSGHGNVETIDHTGFKRWDLEPGTAFVFTPGTIHRLINPNRDLEILVVMQNQGLPESGDAAVCFEPELLADADAFAAAMSVATPEEAAARRDRGVTGFLQLKRAFDRSPEEGRRALQEFYAMAIKRVAPKAANWRSIVEKGPLADANLSLERVTNVLAGDISHLLTAHQYLSPPQPHHKLGFCGILDPFHTRPGSLE